MSSFVMIQEMSSPSSSVAVPPSTAGHLASPVIDTKSYPVNPASSIAIAVLESTVVVDPDVTTLPSTEIPKSSTPALPPLSLVTDLVSVIVGATSSFVIVQVFVSPTAIVPEHSIESVSVYPGSPVSATEYDPAIIVTDVPGAS